MPEITKSSVLAVSGQESTQLQLGSALETSSEFTLLEILTQTDGLVKQLHNKPPDLLVFDYLPHADSMLDLMEEISMLFPEIAMIAFLPGENPQLAQQVMLAGVRAFLIKPFTQTNLINTLRRVQNLQRRQKETAQVAAVKDTRAKDPIGMITVFSPRGGAGSSTIAANLAIALQEAQEARVLLLEGKSMFGHLALMLNIRSQNSIIDLIAHAGTLDPNLIADVVHKHSSGIHVLVSPTDIQAAQGIRAQDLFNVVNGLKPQYDYIVVDGGSTINENSITLMDLSDRLLLIATPELAALHDVSRFMEISHTLGYTDEKVRIVINRMGMPGGIKKHDVEAALRTKPFVYLPEDEERVVRSLNRGVPLLFRYPRSPLSRALYPLAASVSDSVAEKSGQNGRVRNLGFIRSRAVSNT